jgi:hypothetical protein
MPGKRTPHQSPLIVQLVKNREEQLVAQAQKNPEAGDHNLQFFTRQPTQGVDFELAMEWLGVFFQVFWLALLSGSFLFFWIICFEVGRLLVARL